MLPKNGGNRSLKLKCLLTKQWIKSDTQKYLWWWWTYLGKQHPLWLQVQTHAVTLVVQEVLQPEKLDSTERTPVTPVNRDLQLTRLNHKRSAQNVKQNVKQTSPCQQNTMCVCVCVCFTRSSSNVNFWSQDWLLTGFQLVWPTTVLSSFNTALISSDDRPQIIIDWTLRTRLFTTHFSFIPAGAEANSLDSSSLLVRFLELTPLFRFALLMKEERVSLGLQPGSGTDAALERPGTCSRRSWHPMSLTSNVPEVGSTTLSSLNFKMFRQMKMTRQMMWIFKHSYPEPVTPNWCGSYLWVLQAWWPCCTGSVWKWCWTED